MMTALRNNTKPIIWFTAIAFVIGFILILGTDLFFGSRASQRPALARVNGEPITVERWQQALQQARQNYRNTTGQDPDPAAEVRLRVQTWQGLIEDILVAQEARRMGIKISDEELRFALLNQPLPEFLNYPAFQTDGRFDLAKYQQAILNPNFNSLPLENSYRRTLPLQRVQERVLLTAQVSPGELWEIFRQRNEKVRFQMAHIPVGKVTPPETQPTEEELAEFLAKNRDRFHEPERASLAFVRLEKRYSVEDSLEALDLIRNAKEELEMGEDFEILVEAYSEAPPERRGGDRAAWLRPEQIVPKALRDSVMALEPGENTGIVAAADGFHIVKLLERTTEEDKTKLKIADIFVPLRPSYETLSSLMDRALALADSARSLGLAEAAAAAGLPADTTSLFTRDGFPRGLGRVQAAMEFAFRHEPGEVSPPIETADAFYVVQVVERLPERDPPLEDIRDRVRMEWIQEQRRQEALRRAEAIARQAAETGDLKAATDADSLARFVELGPLTRYAFIPGVGSDPELMGHVFAMDTTSAPQAVLTLRAAYVVKLLEKIPASREEFEKQKATLRQQILQQRQQEVLTAWIERLKETAEIEDNRRVLFSL
jgi:parvulin-like peptidyl-prolyl isomerase